MICTVIGLGALIYFVLWLFKKNHPDPGQQA
jgi:hypothetical protein